jgi:hypothetical protein
MPKDLPLFLLCIVPSILIGLGIGLALRRYSPRFCERYAAGLLHISWWFYASSAIFLVLMTLLAVSRGWWSFAAFFGGGALLELVATGLTLGRRTAP